MVVSENTFAPCMISSTTAGIWADRSVPLILGAMMQLTPGASLAHTGRAPLPASQTRSSCPSYVPLLTGRWLATAQVSDKLSI